MNKRKQAGIIIALIGAIMLYWAQTHSPNAGIGKIIGNELAGRRTLDETSYYLLLCAGVGFLIFGIMRFIKK